MKKEMMQILAGIGISDLSEKRRKVLMYVLLSSLGAHFLGLLIFGSVIVMRAYREETTIFETPPPAKTYEPRKLEHRVKVRERQRSSSRPSMLPRMVSAKPSMLNLPQIQMDPKVIKSTFQPKYKPVAGVGMGVGLGAGYGLGGFGEGVSSFDFFGIRGQGDRIVILVDVSVSMVEEERGGPNGFVRVKNRINKVIDAFNDTTLFNVVAFADAARQWQSELVIANQENRDAAKQFLQPFNTANNWGLSYGNVQASNIGVPAVGGTTRLDLALTAALQLGADTILIISDGLPRVQKGLTAEQLAEFEQTRRQWYDQNQERLKEWQAAEAAAQYEEVRVWVPDQPARPAIEPSGPPREGQAQTRQPARPAIPGHWEVRRQRVGNAMPRPQPPATPDPGFWTFEDFKLHLELLQKNLYDKRGRKPPVIHTIGYQIDREGGKFLRRLSEAYRGRYRRVTRID
jgi:hypothetical protein